MTNPLQSMKQACDKLEQIDGKSVTEMAGTLFNLSLSYYRDVRRQALWSFIVAVATALIGIVFFFYALRQMMLGAVPASKLSLIAGLSIEIVSGIGFYLFARTSHQFSAFHACLERANRYLLANTMCNELDGQKDEMRKELIRIVAKAPLLSIDMVEHGERSNSIQQDVSSRTNRNDLRNEDTEAIAVTE